MMYQAGPAPLEAPGIIPLSPNLQDPIEEDALDSPDPAGNGRERGGRLS